MNYKIEFHIYKMKYKINFKFHNKKINKYKICMIKMKKIRYMQTTKIQIRNKLKYYRMNQKKKKKIIKIIFYYTKNNQTVLNH